MQWFNRFHRAAFDLVDLANRAKAWVVRFGRQLALRLRFWRAKLALGAFNWRVRGARAIRRHSAIAIVVIFGLALIATAALMPLIRAPIEAYFDQARLEALRSFFLGLGSALVGAAAIAFSLVLFAMQTNVERTPHGLFRKLSSDGRLLFAFIGSFAIATSVAMMSLIPASFVVPAIAMAMWGMIAMLLLFLFAYRRALLLISPIEQLRLLLRSVRKDLNRWIRRAKVIEPLWPIDESDEGHEDARHDTRRLLFFRANPHWDSEARTAVRYAVAYSRRYAESGDHEVAEVAIDVIMRINAAYVASKGKTFFATNPFFDNPLTTDGFINTSLEEVKQTFQFGLARNDERQVDQAFRTFAALSSVYLKIEYPGVGQKSHALLAAAYLYGSVETVIPRVMPDVAMGGVRLVGKLSLAFFENAEPDQARVLVDKLNTFAIASIANEKNHPVLMAAVEQMAQLSLRALLLREGARGPLKKLRESLALTAAAMLAYPEAGAFSQTHKSNLSAYYATTEPNAFLPRFTDICNSIIVAEEETANLQSVARNIRRWADGLYLEHRRLLVASIQARSSLAFDLVNWVPQVTRLLLAVANADACPEHVKDDLRRHASFMAATLTWVPMEGDAIRFIESYSFEEHLFEMAEIGQEQDAGEVYTDAKQLLLRWGVAAARQADGWGVLERVIYALTALTVRYDEEGAGDQLIVELRQKMLEAGVGADNKNAISRSIRERLRRGLFRHGHSRIDHALGQSDQARTMTLLDRVVMALNAV
jgi:hypothetical protein